MAQPQLWWGRGWWLRADPKADPAGGISGTARAGPALQPHQEQPEEETEVVIHMAEIREEIKLHPTPTPRGTFWLFTTAAWNLGLELGLLPRVRVSQGKEGVARWGLGSSPKEQGTGQGEMASSCTGEV